MYLDGSNSSIGNSESLMAVIDHLLSLDAMIMLDNLDVEGSYAPLVVELLPTLLRIDRLLRLQGLPADCELASASRHYFTDTRLIIDTLSCGLYTAFVVCQAACRPYPRLLDAERDKHIRLLAATNIDIDSG